MKEFLQKLKTKKEEQRTALKNKIKASTSVDEVRSLGGELETVEGEIRDIDAQLIALENSPAPNVQENARGNEFHPLNTYGQNQPQSNQRANIFDSEEYRSAFQGYVMKGTPIPEEYRDNANTTTTDVPVVLPPVIVNQIITKLEEAGKLYSLVNKTSYAAGVQIPKASFNITASFVGEGQTSDRQKATVSDKISFTYFKLRCEVSMSMEVGTMALAVFEQKFVEQVTKAMLKKLDEVILKGTGSGQPKGILTETPEDGQAISVAAAGKLSYALLCEAEGALPEEYEANAVWCMSKSTFMKFIGMVDDNGQPIARVNYGIGGKPERYLLGREVVTTSNMPKYTDTVTNDTIFAFIFDFSDYTLNTIYDLGVQRKQDWETEDLLTKAVMSVDGKVVQPYSLVTLTKKKQ